MVLSSATTVLDRIRATVQETPAPGGRKLGFGAMGTWCQITYCTSARTTAHNFTAAALQWVANFESTYSRFLPDSVISRINDAAGKHWVDVDDETDRLFALCHELYFFTKGAFDPTSLPLIQLWNWKATPPAAPCDSAIAAAQALVGWRKVQRRRGAIFLPEEGMALDLGGVGKEYAVDRVMQLAQEHGLESVLVDFGQDLRAHGRPPGRSAWHVGLENPKNPGHCWTGVAARDVAVATSGDYLRHFTLNGRRYGHIIDPRTGFPVDKGCRAVTVIAPACTFAGILSTTAFILGPRDGLALIEGYHGAEGCIITEDSRLETKRFTSYVTH
jgi:thiamine biosynthesis lipoprotein